MSEEEKKAIESVKSMFGNITIEKLIKDKIFNITICSLGILDILRVIAIVDNQQKEIKKYKRYFKLAISDLQSEGYMQMPYENIEEYYSKREDIV